MTLSPCKKICSVDKKLRLCVGCYRTLNEITLWTKLNDQKKKKIIFQLIIRKKALLNLKKNVNL
mgnify:CR=1 FL=1